MKNHEDSPHVIALPPVIFLIGLVLGFVLDLIIPAPFIAEAYDLPVGVLIVVLGVSLMMWAVRTFNAAGTEVDVRQPSSKIVSGGPYRYSRNPIYIGMMFIVLGASIWLNSLWILFSLVALIPLIEFGVIRREEAYLERKFGKTYLDYKAKVRRWV